MGLEILHLFQVSTDYVAAATYVARITSPVPMFSGTQQGELPLQPPAPFCTPHHSDLTTSLGPEVAPAF